MERFVNFENNKYKGSLYDIKLGACSVLLDVIKELEVTKGAMILDGYEPEDSCIKFVDKAIENFKEKYEEIRV